MQLLENSDAREHVKVPHVHRQVAKPLLAVDMIRVPCTLQKQKGCCNPA